MWKIIMGLVLTLALLAGLTGGLGSVPVEAASLDGWGQRVPLTLDQTRIDSNLSNFPVLIHLSERSGINGANLTAVFNELGSDANRKKIAVTTADGLTECYVEIEKWDTASREAVLWVKVPVVSGSVDTQLYLYYDRDRADNTARVGDVGSAVARNVWDNGYKLVQHLGESGSGSSSDYRDSTVNGHHGCGGAGNASGVPTRVAGKIGDAQRFDGVNDYIQISDHNDFSVTTTGELTISFWLSPGASNMPTSSGGYIHFLGKGEPGKHEWAFRIYDLSYRDRPQSISFYHWNLSGGQGSGSRWDHAPIPNNDWVYVTGRFGRVGSYDIYEFGNGVVVDRDNQSDFGVKPANGSAPLRLGTREKTTWLLGRLDEFRVSNVARSDAWIKASYYAEGDQLVRFGSVETISNPGTGLNTNPTSTPTPTPTPNPVGNTFGLNSGNYTYTQHAGAIQAMRFCNTAGSGTLTKLELLVADTTPAGKVRLGVYDDNKGKPGIRLLDAGEAPVTNGWVAISGLNLPVTAGYYYWLVYSLQQANDIRYQSSQPAGSHHWADGVTTYGPLPVFYPITNQTGFNSNQYVMRATVIPNQNGGTSGYFGLNSGNSTWDRGSGTLDVMRFKNTAGSGLLTRLELLLNDATPQGKVKMGVYADNKGKPGIRLLDAGEVPVTNGWVAISGLNLPVAAGQYYWLGFELQGANIVRYQTGQAAGSHCWINQKYGTLPVSFPSSGFSSNSSPYVMRAFVNAW
jgi:hypothetical protein